MTRTARPVPVHRRAMVWTRVRRGVRGRERLSPFVDFLAVLLILVALLGGCVVLSVLALRAEEGFAGFVAALAALGFACGLGLYVRAPLRGSVVLRPDGVELPTGRTETTRVVVRWDDVADVRVVPGERRPSVAVDLHDGARIVLAEGEDLLRARAPGAAPDLGAVDLVDAEAVALVLRHLLDHPDDRSLLAARQGLGIVLAFSRPVYGTTEP
ncbi:hypothetical protein [Cellulosimicrobium sp. Marseille-Q4280]|uniref:hypothetical protein n=1 Tax=Cellulosimicrobium sp. Marseille-Q4280 TaxID=2937992 RepID=UPI00203AF8FE|nr:hypothetical protein [Cellulosimicrobium sp. Marseille-Q4280]